MYSYIIVRIIPTVLLTGSRYFVAGIDYYNNSSTSIYMPLSTEHCTCCIFGTTTAETTNICCCCCGCCCCCCCCFCFSVVVVVVAAAAAAAVVVVVVLTLTHRYNAVRGHRGHAPITYILPPPFTTDGILWGSFWMKHRLAVRRSDMLPVRTYVCLFGEESACTTGRWAFGCSDAVMVNI